MLEILPKNPALIFLLNSKHKCGGRVAGDCVVSPGELGAKEGIVNGLISVKLEKDVRRIGTGEEVCEIRVLNGRE